MHFTESREAPAGHLCYCFGEELELSPASALVHGELSTPPVLGRWLLLAFSEQFPEGKPQ